MRQLINRQSQQNENKIEATGQLADLESGRVGYQIFQLA
jgi:hypothetical protein